MNGCWALEMVEVYRTKKDKECCGGDEEVTVLNLQHDSTDMGFLRIN